MLALALLKEVAGDVNKINMQKALIQKLKHEQAHIAEGKNSGPVAKNFESMLKAFPQTQIPGEMY